MITDADIKKLTQKFATKIDLGRFQIETKLEFEKIREEMATKNELRKVMIVLDKVLKEVLAMRQEQTFHVEDHRRINDRLENLEHTSSAP